MPFDQNMGRFDILNIFVAKTQEHKNLAIVLHTMYLTQIANLPKTETKTVIDTGCDHLAPNVAIILFILTFHL